MVNGTTVVKNMMNLDMMNEAKVHGITDTIKRIVVVDMTSTINPHRIIRTKKTVIDGIEIDANIEAAMAIENATKETENAELVVAVAVENMITIMIMIVDVTEIESGIGKETEIRNIVIIKNLNESFRIAQLMLLMVVHMHQRHITLIIFHRLKVVRRHRITNTHNRHYRKLMNTNSEKEKSNEYSVTKTFVKFQSLSTTTPAIRSMACQSNETASTSATFGIK